MRDLLIELTIAYIELGYPLPVDTYLKLKDEGIDVDFLILKHTQ